MKVKDLIEALEYEDQNAEVCIAYNYGDYGRTTVAPEVEYVTQALVKHSDYHRMNALFNEDHDDEADDDVNLVVLLSSTRIN